MSKKPDPFKLPHLAHRKMVGVLAMALPVVLLFCAMVLPRVELRDSLSAFYYQTYLGAVFVGVLFVIGFFLVAYRGYKGDPRDARAGKLAGFSALCVALFPTAPASGPAMWSLEWMVGAVHGASAAVLFLTLIYFTRLFRMTHEDPTKRRDWEKNLYLKRRKTARSQIYLWCGVAMGLSMLWIVLYKLSWLPGWMDSWVAAHPPVFWGEFFAIEAFGISWLVKGRGLRLVNDVEHEPRSFQDRNGETLIVQWRPAGELGEDGELLYTTEAGAYQIKSSGG